MDLPGGFLAVLAEFVTLAKISAQRGGSHSTLMAASQAILAIGVAKHPPGIVKKITNSLFSPLTARRRKNKLCQRRALR
jgi:hypothetical protein